MKKYLFSYDDDNHYQIFWLDGEYIGSLEDISDLLITMYGYGLEDDPYNPYEIAFVGCNICILNLKEEDLDVLHNYLCKPRTIDNRVWKKLIKEDYVNAVNIIKGELT